MGFYEQLREASESRSWEQVLTYYKQEFPGSKTLKSGKTVYAWQSKLATDVARSEGIKRESVMRRFQAERKGKVSAKHQAQYERLGEALPPVPPEGGYHIYGTVWVKYSDDGCEPREIDETVEGEDAEDLARMAEEAIQGIINFYQTGDVNGQGPEWCAEPELYVEAA